MKNFQRAIQLALRYRTRLLISLVCALVAAALWGLNIAAVYPVLQLVEKKKNLQEWVDTKLTDVETDITKHEKELDGLTDEKRGIDALPAGQFRENEQHRISEKLDTKESRLAALRSTQWRYQQLEQEIALA